MELDPQMTDAETVDTNPDAAADAVLQGLLDKHDADSPQPNLFEGLGADDGDEEPSDEGDDETPDEQADEASTEGEGKPDATDVQGIDESLKAALKLDGLPDDLIDLMVKTDRDKAIRYALTRKNSQRDVNLAFQERAELKKQAEVAQTAEPEAAESAQPMLDNLEALTQPLAEEFGEDAAGAVVKLVQTLVQPAMAELQALKDAQAASQTQQIEAAVKTTRQSLVERFPKLADDDTFAKVFERAKRIEPGYADVGTTVQERIAAILGDAAALELGTGSEAADAKRKRASNGPTSPSRKPSPKRLSKDEAEYQAFLEIEANRAG